jgi:glutamate carboxypeptidase
MKSGLLTLIFALEALKETGGIPLSVRAFFNSDEEPGSPDSKAHIPDLIKGIDYACVMEPAEPDGTIIIRRKGIGRYYLKVRGKAAHSGQQPESGINANRELAHLIIAAEDLANIEVGTTIIAGKFIGGTASHIVSDYAYAEIDARVWDINELERIDKGMSALEDSNQVIGTKIEVSGGFHRPPMFQLPGAHILQEAFTTAAEINNFDIKFGGSGAASDGNNLAAAGVPTIDGLGPVGGRAHSGDEYMEIPSFSERTILLATFLAEIADKLEGGQLSG